jgi:hypothetical protein
MPDLKYMGLLKKPFTHGDVYFYLLNENQCFRVSRETWEGDQFDRQRFLDDNVFKTEGEAQKARRKVLRMAGHHPEAINDLMKGSSC